MRGPGPRPIFKTGIRGQAPPKLDDPVVTTEFPKTGKSVPGKKTFGRQSLFLGKDFGGMDNLRMAIWKFFVLRQTLALSKEFRPGVLPKEPPSCFPPGSLLVLDQDPNAGSLRYHPRLCTPDSSDCRIEVDGIPALWRKGESASLSNRHSAGSMRSGGWENGSRPGTGRSMTRTGRPFSDAIS